MLDGNSAPASTLSSVHPPRYLLVLGGASVVASGALVLLSGLGAHVAGYLLASVVTISLVGNFHRIDLQRRQSPGYVSGRALGGWAGVIAGLGLVVAAAHTWSIATALAK
jgi:hypothetical protein